MKELKELSKNLFISIKKLNRFIRYQHFCIFMILPSQQNLSQFMTSHIGLEKLAIHIFTYNSRTINDIFKDFSYIQICGAVAQW